MQYFLDKHLNKSLEKYFESHKILKKFDFRDDIILECSGEYFISKFEELEFISNKKESLLKYGGYFNGTSHEFIVADNILLSNTDYEVNYNLQDDDIIYYTYDIKNFCEGDLLRVYISDNDDNYLALDISLKWSNFYTKINNKCISGTNANNFSNFDNIQYIVDLKNKKIYLNTNLKQFLRDNYRRIKFFENSFPRLRKIVIRYYSNNNNNISLCYNTLMIGKIGYGFIYFKPFKVNKSKKIKFLMIFSGNPILEIYNVVSSQWEQVHEGFLLDFKYEIINIRVKMCSYDKIKDIYMLVED